MSIKQRLAILGITGLLTAGGTIRAEKVEIEIPGWLAATEIYGDLRLRQQWDDVTSKATRSRQRIRFRLNGETTVYDRLIVGYGLATGGGDPRSTNQTLDNNFETPDIRLNNAFLAWTPIDDLLLWGGKYKGVKYIFWRPTDLLWDSDLTPDGAGASFTHGPFFAYGGWLILDENKNGSDPGLGYAQAGVKIPFTDEKAHLKAAFSAYLPNALQGAVLEHSNGNNTTNANGGLTYDYTVLQGTVELAGKDLAGLDKAALLADYAMNTDPGDNNQAWDAGFKVSKSRFAFKYLYRYLEKDAFPDIFPDSDAFDGQTGAKGHELELKVKLAEHVILVMDVYNMTRIDGDTDWNVAQLDLVVNF